MTESIGGYELLDDGTPIYGGIAYSTRHPTSGNPLVLRRHRGEWLSPSDTIDLFQSRAQASRTVVHPNLATVQDCGFVGSDVFIVLPPYPGANLEMLIRSIGPMPTELAVEFVTQAAGALQAIHDAGLVHGDVRPANLVAHPLVEFGRTGANGQPLLRPADDAVITLTGFGLVPRRPGAREWAMLDPLAKDILSFLPPERIEIGLLNRSGDVYGLGATLFYLLTAQPPFVGSSAVEVVNAIEHNSPAHLRQLRADVPEVVSETVMAMLSRDPAARPATVAEAVRRFQEGLSGETVPLTPAPVETAPVVLAPAPVETAPVELAPAPAAAEWTPEEFVPAAGDQPKAASPRAAKAMTQAERAKLKMWMYLGIGFWVFVAPILWAFYAYSIGCFNTSKPDTKPEPKKRLK